MTAAGDDAEEQRWADAMRAAQAGDPVAYEALLLELSQVARRFLLRRLGAREFVEDVVQEVLLSVHRGRHTWDPDRPFRPWFFAILRHRCIEQLRRRRTRTSGTVSRRPPPIRRGIPSPTGSTRRRCSRASIRDSGA